MKPDHPPHNTNHITVEHEVNLSFEEEERGEVYVARQHPHQGD
jgi:hypothetical protein